jgi:hypothetical protein
LDAISAARSGVISAISRFDGASADLANAFSGGGNQDPATAVIAQDQASEAFRASLAAIETSNKMFKALLDITV